MGQTPLPEPTYLQCNMLMDTSQDLTNGVRYEFELRAIDPSNDETTVRKFIIDVPFGNDSTDVWVLGPDNQNLVVQVGDSPEDGFATFAPVPA